MRLLQGALALTILGSLLAACDSDGVDEPRLTVVATTTVLGDVVENVVGTDAEVEVLTPVGADPHDFQASSAQVASVNQADLVVANGLGLEEGLDDVLDAAVHDGARVLEVAPNLDPLPFGSATTHEADAGDEGTEDPHVWFDPLRMADAAGLIARELDAIAPDVDWLARAEEYGEALAVADAEIVETLSSVESGKRSLVTNHDSLGYFADRYGFEVVGVVVPGGSTLADPSSAELADLVAVMEREGVSVIFGEANQPQALAEAVGAELDEEVQVVELYTGSVGEPGTGAETLVGMLTTNAGRIAQALGT